MAGCVTLAGLTAVAPWGRGVCDLIRLLKSRNVFVGERLFAGARMSLKGLAIGAGGSLGVSCLGLRRPLRAEFRLGQSRPFVVGRSWPS